MATSNSEVTTFSLGKRLSTWWGTLNKSTPTASPTPATSSPQVVPPPQQAPARKLRVATTSLAGCFGCHMSLLDIDERLLDLIEKVEFDRTPITDIKHIGPCDLGLIEGGVCNAENVHVLKEFRENCKILIAVGACAFNGGVPALRNHYSLKECLEESYLHGIGVANPQIPNDPEIPPLLNKVHPLHEVVTIDYFLPGCPPSGDAFWTMLTELLAGQEINLPYTALHYD